MTKKFAYFRPLTLKEAVDLLQTPGAALLAGGTDLLGCLRDGVSPISRVVSLNGIQNLKGISVLPTGGVQIGALTTLAEIAENEMILRAYPGLAEAAAAVGSPQIRNQGTIGGNLCQRPRCWYFRGDFECLRKGGKMCSAAGGQNQYHCILGGDGCYYAHPSDTAPALVALGAQLRIHGPRGQRVVSAEGFFVTPAEDPTRETVLQPGEIITQIALPDLAAGTRSAYRKVRERAAWDFALAGAAIVLQMDGQIVRKASIILSGVAPIPWRAKESERVLIGKSLDADISRAAGEAAVKGAQALEYNAYKVTLVQGLLGQMLLST